MVTIKMEKETKVGKRTALARSLFLTDLLHKNIMANSYTYEAIEKIAEAYLSGELTQ